MLMGVALRLSICPTSKAIEATVTSTAFTYLSVLSKGEASLDGAFAGL